MTGLWLVLIMLLTACGSDPAASSITFDSPATNADWPQAGHDAAQTAANPAFGAINPANLVNLRTAWVYRSDGPLTLAPVVVGNNLYLNDGRGTLLALDRTNGQLRWTFKYSGLGTGSPVATSDRVWLANDTGSVYALNANDGKQIWQRALNRIVVAAPSYNSGTLWVATLADAAKKQPAALLALDPADGKSRWEYELPAASLNDAATASQTFRTTPPLANNAFFLADRLSELSGGVVRISADQKTLSSAWANPNGGGLLAPNGDEPLLFTTLARNGAAMAVPATKNLTAPYWYYAGPADAESNSTPLPGAFADQTFTWVANDYSGHAHLTALDERGNLRWEQVLESRSEAAPTIAAGLVLLGDESGQINVFDLHSGKKLWQYATGAAVRAAVIPAGEMLYAASGDGNLYAFSLTAASTASTFAPGQNGTLAVYAAPDGQGIGQIYALKAGQPVQLTGGDFAQPDLAYPGSLPAKLNRSPALSPDGRKIAFVSFSKGATNTALWLMDSDGSHLQPLPDTNAEPTDLSWTTDNQTLLFVSSKDGQLYAYNFGSGDGVGLHALTTNYYGTLRYPHTSPDNRYIFWQQTNRDIPTGVGKGRIVRLDRNGQNLINLITGLNNLTGMAVSPLSGRLAYAANDTDGQSWLWLTDAQGGQRRKLGPGVGPLEFAPDGRLLYVSKPDATAQMALTLDPGNNLYPQSSPTKIADQGLSWVKPDTKLTAVSAPTYQPYYFPAQALQNLLFGKYVFSMNGAIYESDPNAVRLAQLTPGGANHDSNPKLSRDGSNIVFVRQATSGQPQIWVMDALGQTLRQLTSSGSNTAPNWSGDGKFIVYISQREAGQGAQVWTIGVEAGESSAKAVITQDNNVGAVWSPDNKTIFFATDHDATTANIDGVAYKSTNLFRVAPDGSDLNFVSSYKVEEGWLGIANLSFQAGGRYITFVGLRFPPTADGSRTLTFVVGVHDVVGPLDYNTNTNCAGSSPTWVYSKEVACIRMQPLKFENAARWSQNEPAGTWVKGIFDATKLPDQPLRIMLDPRRYQITGLSWAEK